MKRSRREPPSPRAADLPWPASKRMASDAGSADSASGLAVSHRFGFGFRPPVVTVSATKSASGPSPSPPSASTSNQLIDEDGAPATNANVKQEAPETEVPTKTEQLTKCELPVRARGRQSQLDRSLPRPSIRKTSGPAKLESTAIAAPQSTGRQALKQGTLTGIPTRRASTTTLSRHDSTRSLGSISGPMVADAVENSTKENEDPSAENGLRIDDIMAKYFGPERVGELEGLLQLRLKAKKYDAKARQEELQSHNRQMKTAIRNICDSVKAFHVELSTVTDQTKKELRDKGTRIHRLQTLMTEKDLQVARLRQETDGLRQESDLVDSRIRDLTEQNKQLLEAQQHTTRVRMELEASIHKLQTQLHQLQKQNDELTLEVRAHQTTMSDRAQLYEEKKKELEQFYQRRDLEDEKRKTGEIERLQTRLGELREELAASNQEKASLRRRCEAVDEEARKERDRSTALEREKSNVELLHKSVEGELAKAHKELEALKDKLTVKEDETSKMFLAMTEMQKASLATSTKSDAEKKELADRVDALQAQVREAERKESANATALVELRFQVESHTAAKADWSQKEELYIRQVKDLENQLQELAQKASVDIGVRQTLESQIRELRTEHIAVNAHLEAVRMELKRLHNTQEDEKSQLLASTKEAEARFQEERASLHLQLEKLQEEKVSAESELKTLRERAANVRDEDLEELCQVKREAEVLRLRVKEMSNHGVQSIAIKDRQIEQLQEQIRQGEKLRRMMHNTIQELRGNVRVFARTRPFLPSDGSSQDPESAIPAVSCEYDGQTIKLRKSGRSSNDQDIYPFTFDKVFSPSAGQDTVFEEVSEFVQSAMDGYHVCLFSYGQTGSGKTHTMQGSGNGQMRGIIPRAIEKVLCECSNLKEQGWMYTMQVSFLEIYNETLKDLLATKEDANKTLTIKKDLKGGVHVPELTLVDVQEIQQVEKLMERANRARSVASTDMNAQSSRSHSVFTLHLHGVNDSEGIILDGQLNLVDLAGSERASRSNVSGDRLKETQAINKSLSCLADVFTAIGNKSAHIPFRNSKLTYLLQSSLSGDGKTLMMVNVSPTQESAGETLCSLRFAQQVNKCELGKPKRQIKSKKDAQ